MATYVILAGSKDEKTAASVGCIKQTAILTAWRKGGGQKTSAQIAESATALIGDEDVKVSAQDVTRFVAAVKSQKPAKYAALPKMKVGKKGKSSLAAASDDEFDALMDESAE